MNARGSRRAAAALTAMHPSDRRWVLKRLPREKAQILRRLVLDLADIAPAAIEYLDDLIRDPLSHGVTPPAPDELVRVLHEMTPSWAACVLRAIAPDHVDLYAASCDRQRAIAVQEAVRARTRDVPVALARELAIYVRDRVKATAEYCELTATLEVVQ